MSLACTKLDTRIDTQPTDETINTGYTQLWGFGYAPYGFLQHGFFGTGANNSTLTNLFAAAADEAEETDPTARIQLFNQGAITPFSNPDDVYANHYAGIRAANYFLENSEDYVDVLARNRDIISDNGRQYQLDIQDIGWLRAEARVLRAYYYVELIKRYGGVPLVRQVLQPTDDTDLPRASYDEVMDYIVSEIDGAKDHLQTSWKDFDAGRDGRFTKGAAMALKSRALLYAASPLNNPNNDLARWQRAAEAALELIRLDQYGFQDNYGPLFLDISTVWSPEIILSIRLGATNELERKNYPIGTPGGATGVTPSHNLVEVYEYTGPADPANPYANRDPRLAATVAHNGSNWTGRTLEPWSGGQDDPAKPNASRTGYYLKKFLNDNLNLVQGEQKLRSWVVFRYPEILLNYAEAMNEAYGPDDDNGFGISARQALDRVRTRAAVGLAPVVAGSQAELRERIKHERRVELAFEGHRYWDLLRWKDAETALNQPLKGIRVARSGEAFQYTVIEVEWRNFQAPKMYLYPIPQTEIGKSTGVLSQNPLW